MTDVSSGEVVLDDFGELFMRLTAIENELVMIKEQQEEIIEKLVNLSLPGGEFEVGYGI